MSFTHEQRGLRRWPVALLGLAILIATEASTTAADQTMAPAQPGSIAAAEGFQAFDEAFNGISPACPYIAVGMDHIVTVSNNGIRFFTKSGEMTYDNTFSGRDGFFPGGGTPFNPQAIFDPHSGRFVVAGYYTYAFDDFITVAISDDGDPNGDWHRHTIDVNSVNGITLFDGDRITLGVDAKAIYAYCDFFFASDPQDPFSHGFIFSVDKRELMRGGTPRVVAVEPFQFPASLAPARTYEADAPAQYFVTPFGTYIDEDKIRLFALRDALGEPVVDTIELEVPPYDFLRGQHGMPHPGGSGLTATDTRMRRAVFRDGALWTAHHVRDVATGRHIARWYEIRMNGWPVSGEPPTLAQSGDIDLGPRIHTFLPDIAPDAAGNALIIFHHTSADTPPAMARALHSVGAAPGSVRNVETIIGTEVLLGASSIYAASAAADLDPANERAGWVGGAYWIRNRFGGRNPALWVAPVSLPCGGDLDGDRDVDHADYAAWQECFGGPAGGNPGCDGGAFDCSDADGDDDVDLRDFASLQNAFGER